MSIEGIPDGWEFVRVGRVKRGEFYVDWEGSAIDWNQTNESSYANYVIIRKIEKPKQFRAFANEREAEPFWDAKLRYKVSGNSKEPGKAMFRVNCIGEVDVGIAFSVYSYQTAFELFECIDGTPFGVEVTE